MEKIRFFKVNFASQKRSFTCLASLDVQDDKKRLSCGINSIQSKLVYVGDYSSGAAKSQRRGCKNVKGTDPFVNESAPFLI